MRPAPRIADPEDADGAQLLATAKRAGFADRDLAALAGVGEGEIRTTRGTLGLEPGYAMVDTCAAEFAAETPYFYSTYASAGSPPEAPPVQRPAALVIGSGPVRIGQGIEFDYCAVQAADVLRREGWSAVMVNSNPETVSTDFDASTRLYFEPLDAESVLSIVTFENGPAGTAATHPDDTHGIDVAGVIDSGRSGGSPGGRPAGYGSLPAVVAFGGQTPLNLAAPLVRAGVPLLGSSLEAIDQAEERTRFSALLDRLGIPQPEGGMAESIEEALTLAERIGYPVIVRPSFVIGGLAIDFAYSPEDLARHLAAAAVVDPDRPVRIDRFLEGIEVDVDAVCDGKGVLIPGLLEHVERAGVHSGDSIGVFPPQHVAEGDRDLIVWTMERICLALGARGLVNAQFIVREDGVYLIEVNPRASRTVPFLSKVTGRADGGARGAHLARRDARRARLGDGAAARPDLRRGQGAGVLDGQAQGRRPVGRAVHAVDRRGHRDRRRPARGDGEGAHGGVAGPAPHGRGRGRGAARAALDRRPRQVGPRSTSRGRWIRRATGWPRRLGPAPCCSRPGSRPRRSRSWARNPAPGEAGILELIADGHVRLVVNTPTPRSGAVRDAADIRHAAIAEGMLCLTAIETGGRRGRGACAGHRRRDRQGPPDHGLGADGRGAGRGRGLGYRGRSRLTRP